MKLFGITGGIGSGKTVVATELLRSGYPVYFTDLQAQHIIHHNPCVRSQIELLFGSDIYQNDHLDRARVAELVFNNPQLLTRLNSIVHPAVRFDIQAWASKNEAHDFCFVESAILFESGLNTLCDAVITVNAPLETRIQRTVMRDNTTRDSVISRLKNQMTDEDRTARADFHVENNGTKEISRICLDILSFCRNFAD